MIPIQILVLSSCLFSLVRGDINHARMSSDARYVVFSSSASDLVPHDTNGVADVFLYDRINDALQCISHSSIDSANGNSDFPAVSDDGSVVAFWSAASNLVEGDTNNRADVFVWHQNTGSLTRASVTTTMAQSSGHTGVSDLSADGVSVALLSDADLATDPPQNESDVFVRNLVEGTTTLLTTHDVPRVRLRVPGAHDVRISGDGKTVMFIWGNDIPSAGDTNRQSDVYIASPSNKLLFCPNAASVDVETLSCVGNLSATGQHAVWSVGRLDNASHSYSWQIGITDVVAKSTTWITGDECREIGIDAIAGDRGVAMDATGRFIAFVGINQHTASMIPVLCDVRDNALFVIDPKLAGHIDECTMMAVASGGHVLLASIRLRCEDGTRGESNLYLIDRETGRAQRVSRPIARN